MALIAVARSAALATVVIGVVAAGNAPSAQATDGAPMPTTPPATPASSPATSTPQQRFTGYSPDGVRQYDLPDGAVPVAVHPNVSSYLADYTFPLGGYARSFRVYVPTGLVGPAPVVMAMSGWMQSGDPEGYMHWRGLARAKHFVVVEPRGVGSSWHAGRCCGYATQHGIDDNAMLLQVLRFAGDVYPVNGHRVYVTGFSNGGMMAYEFACRHPEIVAGIGVVAAAYMSHGSCMPTRPVPVVHVHGRADSTVPPAGTPFSSFLGTAVPSAAQTDAVFGRIDAASGVPTRAVYLPGLGHTWPHLGGAGNYDATGKLLSYLWQFSR